MIILFPINQFDRDKLREMTDEELVAILRDNKEAIPVYPTIEEFLTDVDDQTIDTDRYWHCNVDKLHVVTCPMVMGQTWRIVCRTPEEAALLTSRFKTSDQTVTECYDGSPLTLPDPTDPKVRVMDLPTFIKDSLTIRDTTPIHIKTDTFSVTFIYETPMSKTRCTVECRTNEEAMKIAHDANSVQGIKYVRIHPCKRPVGSDGLRMSAEDYWKMYGNK